MKAFFFTVFISFSAICSSQILFDEVSEAKGVFSNFGIGYLGGGISFCDYDDDGWDDITMASEFGEQIKVFRNTGGTFQLVSLPFNQTYETKQVTWVDFDNDGDKDFFAASNTLPNVMFRCDGGNTFTDISQTCGLFTENLNTFGTSWGDYNNDGLLDVFISNLNNVDQNERNYLYKNNGDGFFTDVTASVGIDIDNNLTFCASFFDYDNDGDQDIYMANDRNFNPNKLYRNNGDETFTDVSEASNMDLLMSAMSVTVDDFDNDGWLDVYITNTPAQVQGTVIGNALMRNNGDGTFTNVADVTQTTFNSFAWGAVFLDADLDSDRDLYVSGLLDGSSLLPSAFYENDGNNVFSIPSGAGFSEDISKSYSNAIGDFNNDGKQDIVVLNEDDNMFLWENKSSNVGNYIKVKLQGTVSNRDGIGSWIEVTADGKTQYNYTLCGEGYIAQNSMTEIIGVGNATQIDNIKIRWLSGIEDNLYNVNVNQTITIEESSTLSNAAFKEKSFRVYPNPTNDMLTIYGFNNSSEKAEVIISDTSGRIIFKNPNYNSNSKIDFSTFPSGIYILSVSNKNYTTVERVIKY